MHSRVPGLCGCPLSERGLGWAGLTVRIRVGIARFCEWQAAHQNQHITRNRQFQQQQQRPHVYTHTLELPKFQFFEYE